jgi:hypothetical protein
MGWILSVNKQPEPYPGSAKLRGGNVNRPRAADDFATIRARLEELRRERAQAFGKESCDPDDTASGRGLLKGTEGRPRLENERWPAGSSSRRYGSGR